MKKIVFNPKYVIHCPFITKELILILQYKTFQQNRDFSKPIFFFGLTFCHIKAELQVNFPILNALRCSLIVSTKGPWIPLMVRFINLSIVARN